MLFKNHFLNLSLLYLPHPQTFRAPLPVYFAFLPFFVPFRPYIFVPCESFWNPSFVEKYYLSDHDFVTDLVEEDRFLGQPVISLLRYNIMRFT